MRLQDRIKLSDMLPAAAATSLLLCAFAPEGAHAQGYERFSRRASQSRDADIATYDLSIAGAVSAPSSTGFIGENPAGLIYTTKPNLQGYVASDKDHPGLLSNGVSVGAGHGLAAATIGVQSFSNATDDKGSITRFTFGVATYAEALGMVVGLNGAYRFTNLRSRPRDPGLEATWTANLGMLFNPFGTFRFGLNLFELDKGMTGVALGSSMQVNSVSVVSLDAGVDRHGRGLTIKPGIGVSAGALSLTYAYGMVVDREFRSNIAPGNTLGIGLRASETVQLQGYYNHFQEYFLSVRLGF